MRIIEIKKRKKSLLAVYFDGGRGCDIDEPVLIDKNTFFDFGYAAGDSISNEDLEALIAKSYENRAKEKGLWLISKKDYTKKQLYDKIRKDTTDEAAAAAIERLSNVGLINDERYARRYAADLINIKKLSKRAAMYELALKGVEKELAQEVVDEMEIENEDTLRQLIERKYIDSLDDEKMLKRMYNALIRKGYGYSEIKTVIREINEEII